MTIDKLFLIDGHALAYRMYFAMPVDAFTTQAGEPTNATYGFARRLLELMLDDQPPKYLAVSFDLGLTFRDELFDDYKGTREKMPDDLSVQIDRIKQLVQTLNIPILEIEDYEADDVLGTIARQAKGQIPVRIITGDRDLLQLVDDNTEVELPGNRFRRTGPELYDIAAVEKKYGLKPPQIVDLKALMGDSSDNIPGVAGVGEKTATRLLQKYGTVTAIYDNLDEVQKRWRTKLEAGQELAQISYKLAKIITDAPIELDLEACLTHDFDVSAVVELFRELEFRSLTTMLLAGVEESESVEIPTAIGTTETTIVRTPADLQSLVTQLNSADVISFDVETTGLDKISTDLVGICLAVESPAGYYIPIKHLSNKAQATSGQMDLFASDPQLAPDQLSLNTVLDAIRPAMTNPNIRKVAHNAKFDYIVLQRHGLTVTPLSYDTMIAEWLLDPQSKFLGLKPLTLQRLGIQMTDIESLIGKGKKQITFAEVPIEDAAPYGAADADMTLRLMKQQEPEIEATQFKELLALEMSLIPVLAAMEQAGVSIDRTFFAQMSQELADQLAEHEEKIHDIAGEIFNVNSTQQLSDILFKKLDLPHEGLRRTKSGHFSTAASVLDGLQEADETGIIDAILAYRELGKLKSTYVDALPALVNEETGRLHTSFNQTGSVTGRLASNSPNLQNIPIRSEIGQQIRRGFVAQPGWLFLAADYSQVELRILAHISQDPALLHAFHDDQDIHRATAASVFGITADEVTYNQRRFAKAVNFGLIYGMGAFRLARDSELTLAEAENYIEEYFARFPGIKQYLDDTKKKAHTDFYVETLLGRRRYFPIFDPKQAGGSFQARLRAEREAINHPIQGTAADIIKIAMVRLHDALADYRAFMSVQVHDELLLEVPADEIEVVEPLVIDIMSSAYKLDVPLKVDSGTGQNWLEIKG